MSRNTQKEVHTMKMLKGLLFFGILAFLIALPLSAMGANLEKVNKSAGLGLAGGQIAGDAFAYDHGFSNIHSATASLHSSAPAAWNAPNGNARRPPFYAGPWTPPPWWTPPRRPPWASPHR